MSKPGAIESGVSVLPTVVDEARTTIVLADQLLVLNERGSLVVSPDVQLKLLSSETTEADKAAIVRAAVVGLMRGFVSKEITPRQLQLLMAQVLKYDLTPDLSLIQAALTELGNNLGYEVFLSALPTNMLLALGCPDIEFCDLHRFFSYLNASIIELARILMFIDRGARSQAGLQVLFSQRDGVVEHIATLFEHLLDRNETGLDTFSVQALAHLLAQRDRVSFAMERALLYLSSENYSVAQQLVAHLGLSKPASTKGARIDDEREEDWAEADEYARRQLGIKPDADFPEDY